VGPFPQALQLPGKDFVLAAFGSHDGKSDFIAASRFRGLRGRRQADREAPLSSPEAGDQA
jgi:hypothetical protein